MANGDILLPPPEAKLLDTEEVTVDATTKQRERHRLSGLGENEHTEVKSSDPTTTMHGAVVRDAPHPVERLSQKNTDVQTNQILKAVAGGEIFVVTSFSIWVNKKVSVNVNVLLELGTAAVGDYDDLSGGDFIHEAADGPGGLARGALGDDLLLTNTVPSDGAISVHVSGYIV